MMISILSGETWDCIANLASAIVSGRPVGALVFNSFGDVIGSGLN
jgi:hypothetical protein